MVYIVNVVGVVIRCKGHAGIGESVLIVLLTSSVSLVALLSAIGISERSHIDQLDGGIYSLMCHVLGARLSATVSIIYCLGQVRFFSARSFTPGICSSSLFVKYTQPYIIREKN